MEQKNYLKVVSVIFFLIALLHLLRVSYGWFAFIDVWEVPMWLSWVAVVVVGYLGYEGWRLSK